MTKHKCRVFKDEHEWVARCLYREGHHNSFIKFSSNYYVALGAAIEHCIDEVRYDSNTVGNRIGFHSTNGRG